MTHWKEFAVAIQRRGITESFPKYEGNSHDVDASFTYIAKQFERLRHEVVDMSGNGMPCNVHVIKVESCEMEQDVMHVLNELIIQTLRNMLMSRGFPP